MTGTASTSPADTTPEPCAITHAPGHVFVTDVRDSAHHLGAAT